MHVEEFTDLLNIAVAEAFKHGMYAINDKDEKAEEANKKCTEAVRKLHRFALDKRSIT